MKIAILIPIYNESKNIAQIVQAVRAKNLDVIAVDDGSSDGCGDLAKDQGAHVITHLKQTGKGLALRDGFDYICDAGYDGLITMDGDGQHAIEDLDSFLKMAQKFPESVISGDRMSKSKGMPWLRRMTNRFMSGLISWACKQSVPDTQCGYRYFGANVLKCIQFSTSGFEIETESLIKASKKGFKIHSVPVQTIYRDETSHINPIRDTLRFFKYFFKEIFSK